MPVNLKPFVVSAQSEHHSHSETRGLAASAMVLADLWADKGRVDIAITDRTGQRHTRDGFRALFCGGKKARRALA